MGKLKEAFPERLEPDSGGDDPQDYENVPRGTIPDSLSDQTTKDMKQ